MAADNGLLPPLPMNGSPIPLDLQEIHSLESRSRSGTWPLSEGEDNPRDQSESPVPNAMGGLGMNLKTSSPADTKRMRNAWGNMSYADLITQAILSSAEKRLTLSEIYEWIVQNIPYFADKASSPSTAGWKNSVRHNLSLHSRFVKVQNESSGKSSWWTVNLDAKTNRGRRRASSVDNSNTPSPRARKKEKTKKLKKIKGAGSSSDLQTSSPCDSPTGSSQGFHQSPWSPSTLMDCPSPGSDRSATYSPVSFSPVLQRHSRNVTPVSPLVSPPGLDQSDNHIFSGSNSSLLDSYQDSSSLSLSLQEQDSASQQCIDSMASLNLRSSRDGMGSSSSLSSLNSPRLQQLKPSPQPVFNFPISNIDQACSPVTPPDCDQLVQQQQQQVAHNESYGGGGGYPPLPAYEEHMTIGNSSNQRLSCGTPTRQSHPLHISVAYDGRPRSGSEPATNHPFHNHHHHHRLPNDIDPELFTLDFKDLNIQDVLKTEMQYGGNLGFPDAPPPGHNPSHLLQRQHHTLPNDPTLTSAALGNHLQHMNNSGSHTRPQGW